ncbi:MAG TPA: DoxX family protein [Phycisphaerales bacterium]|nr:DoxX family protein [Phycisphaerales bacterium]
MAARFAVTLGIIEVLSTVIYLFPKTSVLGAILLTGYLGGAMATHMRIEEGVFIQFGLGVVLWLGLFLRSPRLRSLIPFVTAR